jgi:hypothetical protein
MLDNNSIDSWAVHEHKCLRNTMIINSEKISEMKGTNLDVYLEILRKIHPLGVRIKNSIYIGEIDDKIR